MDPNKISKDDDGYINHPDIPGDQYLCWQHAERLECPAEYTLTIDDDWMLPRE
jgi:hypothetical protein